MKSKLRSLFLLALFFSANTSLGKEKSQDTPCIDDNKFYRNPNAPAHNVWSPAECAKYYLCLDNEVFEFRCSQGLLFDVSRQVCDFKANVDNCDVMSESQPPRPLLEDGDCGKKHLACGDGTCFPATYFCDGSVDCPDGSDEAWCDIQDDPNGALPCNPEQCQLPNCWCSKDGTKIPGNLTTSMVPQMITITFDDAVNAENFEVFSKIFSNDRKNPNGCPIRGTFYVSHQYTNYRDVQYLWNVGHEIAAHSVTHRGPEDWWSRNATIEDWFDEMVGVANIINKYAAVRLEDIKGLRTPFLRVGWNRQFLMMSEFGFVYDSSMLAPFSNVPVWPYTLDYRPPHNCISLEQLCPTRAYPGVWELPINQLLAGQYTCARMDSCPSDLSGEDIYKILMLNFKRHYLSNRAPLGLHFHASWFQNPSYFYAFSKFMDDVLRLNDVYFITTYQMENQGFEEEHQQPRSEETPISSREFRHDSHTFSFDTSGNELSPDDPVSNADGHVYEDILPGVENPSKHSGVMIGQDQALRRPLNTIEYVCKSATARSLDREEIAGTFRRNLTLPFRRGTGLDSSLGSCSIRGTSGKRIDGRREDTEVATWNAGIVAFADDAFSSRAQSIALQSECRPSKKRRKKDCKHCRNKAAASSNDQHHQIADKESETILRKNRNNEQQQRLQISGSNDSQTILDPRNFTMLPVCCPNRKPDEFAMPAINSPSVFTISEKVGGSPASTLKLIRNERSGCANLVDLPEINEDNALIGSGKNRPGMRVNSIYSQDRWYAKGASMLFTDAKEYSSFQRAYSLPVRTQTPSSQNRINLRRSVRGEPPPHPARLRKHRHGWTLHLAHPLEASGCTRPLVLLLIALLLLLGIGAVALYIAFEPEKLQIIQQYLKSSTNDSSSSDDVLAAGTFLRRSNSEQEQNDASAVSSTTPMQPSATSTLATSILLNGGSSFPESRAPLASEAETEATSPSSLNSTRYCDDCLPEEVCVALVDEEAPTCRIPLDHKDPTGCAGFCLINKQKCHRLDVDAFRCVEMEHYCLDDEWTCLNTLCIPLEKHCDGHMNCYDHSDEHNCDCDLETHFQCGNETSCLPLEKRCDGKIDCWDAADEINCTLGLNLACPSENEFTCSNGQCILRARFCDSLPDCLDGSDEPHGCQGRCNKHEFTCQNNRCITKGMKCNGIDDCGDGTDERHCKDRFS